MTTLFQQPQKTLLRPQIKLELRSEFKKISAQALVDTGFDDFLAIGLEIAQKLQPKIVGQTRISVAGGQTGYCKVVELKVKLFEKPDLIEVNLQALVLPDEKEVIIGAALLETICGELEAKLLFNYSENVLALIR